MKPVFLIGYMCSGKTTLGRALEGAADVTYVDLDDIITSEHCLSISDIFKLKGEEEFRRIEAETLARLACRNDIVVGCGGGTACREANMELMNSSGTTVLLEACRERLVQRLLKGRAGRPLIADLNDEEVVARMERDMESRRRHYERAQYRFDSSLLETPEEVSATVERFIKMFNIKRRDR